MGYSARAVVGLGVEINEQELTNAIIKIFSIQLV